MRHRLMRQMFIVMGLTAVCALMVSCASIPPRTEAGAQKEFNDQTFIIGKTTAADLQAALGSRPEVAKEPNGDVTYVFYKSREAIGLTLEIGTTYRGAFTVDANGVLKNKAYSAKAIGNYMK